MIASESASYVTSLQETLVSSTSGGTLYIHRGPDKKIARLGSPLD